MNKHHHISSSAQPKRTIPIPRIVKPAPPAASGAQASPPKVHPFEPLKPASVMKAGQTQKHVPWLTTAKIPRIAPRIP